MIINYKKLNHESYREMHGNGKMLCLTSNGTPVESY